MEISQLCDPAQSALLNPSAIYKGMMVIFLAGFVPVTAVSFILVRRSKKEAEFARVVGMLDIAADEAEFARSRVAEQYAAQDFHMPVLFAWLVACLGFISLLFGADMVCNHPGKPNFLLTGIADGNRIEMQLIRQQSMVVMSLAFMGAFIWSAQNLLYRLNAGDLAPSVYFSSGLRMVLAPVLSLMIAHLISGFENLQMLRPGLPAIAFLVGWFPDRALIFLKERFPMMFKDERSAHNLPLNMIEGVHTYDRARLVDLGITDAQNLANANFIELVVRTAFNPGQIIDWIGQAKLYVYFKDQVAILHRHQVRTVFDLLVLCQDPELRERLAAATELDAMGLQLFCERLGQEPGVQQLLAFRQQLCVSKRRS